jgi:ribonuclease G
MSDAFEAPAEPATLLTNDPNGNAGPESPTETSSAAGHHNTGTPSVDGLVSPEETAPTRARRAPRRTGGRSRKPAPPPEAETPTATAETPENVEAAPAPTPRRRRTRRTIESTTETPPPAPIPPQPDLLADQATRDVAASSRTDASRASAESLPVSNDAPVSAEGSTAAAQEPSLLGGGVAPVEAEAPDDTEILLGEERPGDEGAEPEANGAGSKRRRSRRGSRGGRRSRGRRGATEAEAGAEGTEAVDEALNAESEPASDLAAAAGEMGPVPEVETPLPDVTVYFRPVARRSAPPADTAGEAPPSVDGKALETGETVEGEPTSRGRRRRRRGERGERTERAAGAAEKEERSGIGGALPPRTDRLDLPAEVADAGSEALAERPRVERVGRGQRGDRALERAAARAEREAARATDKDIEKAERVTKEIVINVSPRETRIAVLENGRLVELHVEREERVVGSVYKGKVANVLPGMDAAFVDIGLDRNAFLYVGDILFEGGEEGAPAPKRPRDIKIRDVAKPGQEILVQVVKGPRGTKGARVSTRMSLPGRYIVLMPDADNLGVSRKIEEAAERERLKRIGERLRPSGFGMIIRTEAEERTEEELKQDLELLLKLWDQISTRNRQVKAPALVHQDLSLILKTIRDVFGADVDKLILDSADDHEKVREMLEILSPELLDRVDLYSEQEPIFSRYGLEDEIERLLRRKVWLRSGGYITIDASEALTAIDVNTGKFVGTTSLSDTILKTNLDAVQEIARQLRLRDIGGMIVLDFIDMNSARDRAQVMAALDRALKKDRTRTKVAHISPLGLIEMTRKRTGETVTELITQTCEYCQGRGRTLSPETMSIQIERAVRRKCAEGAFEAVLVHAHPEVCAHLIGPEGENVEAIERLLRRPIYVRARHDFHLEKFEVLPSDMMELEKGLLPYRGGQVVECEVQKMELITAPRSAAWVNGYFVDLANGTRYQGSRIRVRLTDVRRSFALGEPVAPATAVDKTEPI